MNPNPSLSRTMSQLSWRTNRARLVDRARIAVRRPLTAKGTLAAIRPIASALAVAIACLVADVPTAAAGHPDDPGAPARRGVASAPSVAAHEYAPGEVLVQFRTSAGALDRDAAIVRAAGRVIEHVSVNGNAKAAQAPGLERLATSLSVEEAVARLRQDPNVLFAEPNWACSTAVVSNDTYYTGGTLWGVYSDDQPTAVGPGATTNIHGTGVEKLWNAGQTGSRTVYVGLVDEGVQFTHPDLAANIWTNPFDPVDGVDNDHNGFVDDVHGWDFENNDNSLYDGTTDDHGTHTAGTIGSVGGNGQGVAGMNWNVTIIPVKFLGLNGGYISNAVKALDYVTNLKTQHGLDIVATNNSWTTTGASSALQNALIRAAKANILSICAAGNSTLNNDASTVYPANYDTRQATSSQSGSTYDGVISVAAIDRYGALATFSDWGATSVDLGAPGVTIPSTVPTNAYANYSGTSMATPHVVGAAALYEAMHPGSLASEIRTALLSTTVPTASLAGKTVTGGRLSVASWTSGGGTDPVVHDVAVESITSATTIGQGVSTSITLVVANRGTVSETFSVTASDTPPAGGIAGTVSAAQVVTVAAGATRMVGFTWSTTTASVGTHVLTGRAAPVPGETDSADNAMTRTCAVTGLTNPNPVILSIAPGTIHDGDTTLVTIVGQGFLPGARVTFRNGTGYTPTASNVVVAANGTSMTASVWVKSGGPLSGRRWDLVVTNADGKSGSLVGALTIVR